MAFGVDVRLDAVQQPEFASVSRVDVVNGPTLRRRLGHRHAAGDPQSVRMIGDSRVVIAPLDAGIGNVLDRRGTIAPFGVHLQVTEVLVNGWTAESRIGENPPYLRTAQEVPSKRPPSLDVSATLAVVDCLLDGRRCARLEDLVYHARRTGSDAWNSRQGAVMAQHVGQGPVQRQNRRGRSLVAEHLLLRRLRECQIAKIAAHDGIHVRMDSSFLHGRCSGLAQAMNWPIAGTATGERPSPRSFWHWWRPRVPRHRQSAPRRRHSG